MEGHFLIHNGDILSCSRWCRVLVRAAGCCCANLTILPGTSRRSSSYLPVSQTSRAELFTVKRFCRTFNVVYVNRRWLNFLHEGAFLKGSGEALHFLASPPACCWAVGMLHDTFPPPGGAQELPSQRNMKPNHHWENVKLAGVSRCTLFVQVFLLQVSFMKGAIMCYETLLDRPEICCCLYF